MCHLFCRLVNLPLQRHEVAPVRAGILVEPKHLEIAQQLLQLPIEGFSLIHGQLIDMTCRGCLPMIGLVSNIPITQTISYLNNLII